MVYDECAQAAREKKKSIEENRIDKSDFEAQMKATPNYKKQQQHNRVENSNENVLETTSIAIGFVKSRHKFDNLKLFRCRFRNDFV